MRSRYYAYYVVGAVLGSLFDLYRSRAPDRLTPDAGE